MTSPIDNLDRKITQARDRFSQGQPLAPSTPSAPTPPLANTWDTHYAIMVVFGIAFLWIFIIGASARDHYNARVQAERFPHYTSTAMCATLPNAELPNLSIVDHNRCVAYQQHEAGLAMESWIATPEPVQDWCKATLAGHDNPTYTTLRACLEINKDVDEDVAVFTNPAFAQH